MHIYEQLRKAQGQRLRLIRIRAGIERERLAALLEYPIIFIDGFEAGGLPIDGPVLSRICQIFRANPEWLLMGTGEMHRALQPTTTNVN